MTKELLAAAVFAVAGPLAGNAAPISEYSSSAKIYVSLSSATYVDSGADALTGLTLGFWQDENDFGSWHAGTGTHSFASIGHTDPDALWSKDYGLKVEGDASADEPYSESWAGGWVTPAWFYQSGCYEEVGYFPSCSSFEPIRLTFDYIVETSEVTSVIDAATGTARASADAILGFKELVPGEFWGVDYDFGVENGTGTYSVDLMAGRGIGLDLYIRSVSGRADFTAPSPAPIAAPSPVPLPAGGLLLLSGFAGLMALRRSENRAARHTSTT